MRVVPTDLNDSQVIALLNIHLLNSRAQTAPGSAHALDMDALQSPDVTFWTIWDDEILLGMGALKRLSADHGEVKSMHTAQAMRRKGVASAMLRHIIAAAHASGMARLSLETGSWEYFRPARALYKKYGFVECPPFADYVPDPNSVFMTLDLRDQQFSAPGSKAEPSV
ncbi:MAG: GNAT family N-acetyltransferase [Deltaproteobacteria bacterium]|nr:GNAT family N-acetyltransferase [Deltaproteobacteria bacterium]